MRVHFTGIKGVGMAALALAYQDAGWEVTGSDTKDKQITDEPLKNRGIQVFEKFTPRNIWVLKKMVWVPAIDKLIYTGAHHGAQNVEVKWAASRNVPILNYAQALGEFFADKKQICVCGVGGKTTTTAMIATILQAASLAPSWIVGTSEIPSLSAAGRRSEGEWTVIEGDEYAADPAADKTPKFMYLNPKIIVCTNIYYDHPDVYANLKETITAYADFFKKLPEDGRLLISSQVKRAMEENGFELKKLISDRVINSLIRVYDERLEGIEGIERSEESEEIKEIAGIEKARNGNKGIYGNLQEFRNLEEFKRRVREVLKVPGEYNLRNAMAAMAVAREIGISEEQALAGLAQYRGAKRRFEFIGEAGGISLFDDYAHHPTEIRALAAAAKEKFPGKKIRFVFQPHTFSRTKALFSEFADSLKLADEVIMFPIFASAREKKDESVSSQMLAEEIKRRGGEAVWVTDWRKLVEYLVRTAKPEEIIFTVGAGNLYEFHQSILGGLRS